MNETLSRIRDYLEWTVLRLSWSYSRLVPSWAVDRTISFLSTLTCAFSTGMREQSLDKYAKLLMSEPGGMGTDKAISAERVSSVRVPSVFQCECLTEKLVGSFLRNLLELDWIQRMVHEGPREFVTFDHLERLDAALAAGRGAVLATVHLGNWELVGSALSLLGYPLRGVAWTARNRFIQKHLENLRSQTGLVTIFPDASAQIRIYRDLKANRPIAFVLDLGQWENGVPVRFCGNDYLFPKGPLFFAQRTGAALIPSVSYRDETGRIHLLFEKPLDVPSQGASSIETEKAMQTLATVLEGRVRQHPGQWLWVPAAKHQIAEMRRRDESMGALEQSSENR
ncbi:MAG TPA: lysophospholipid acyltransferase family protein [bacterium]|nr:lysophospholipid acyltransferase family protein [bacterium]